MSQKVKSLGQYMTAPWGAVALVERHFGYLGKDDVVIEAGCGRGAFLQALPQDVKAIGVDIDPAMVEIARRETGREIILGDFATVDMGDVRPTAILGNPPFALATVDRFLDRSHKLLPEGGKCGWILGVHSFQTASRVVRYTEKWSLYQEMIPRNLFPNLQEPIVFAIFTKDQRRILVGFGLYNETVDLKKLAKPYREELWAGVGSVWLKVAIKALSKLGGEADIDAIYSEVEGKRPTTTDHWRAQLRKVLRQRTSHFKVVRTGRYALA